MVTPAPPPPYERRRLSRVPAWALDLGFACGIAAAVAAVLVTQGGIWKHVSSGDLHAMLMPWYEYAARSVLREGRLPLWNPHPFCGMPVLALGQTAVLYPPNLLVFTVLQPWEALQALYGIHVLLLTWGIIAYGRRHGIGRVAGGLAALLTVMGVFRGPMLAGVDHPSLLACMAWVPLLLLSSERAAGDRVWRWIGCFALAAAAQWLAGYPDFSFDTPVLLGIVAAVAGEGPLLRRLGVLLAGTVLGTALAAVQLFPLAEAVHESPRVNMRFHDALRSIFSVKSPGELSEALLASVGPAGIVCAAWGLARPTRIRFAWAAAFLWATFALNYPLRLLYLLPPYSALRLPFGWSGCAALFAGLLVAAGFTAMRTSPTAWIRVLGTLLGLAAAGHSLVAVARAPASVPLFRPGSPGFQAPDLDLAATRARVLRDLAGTGTFRVLSQREVGSGAAIRFGISMPNGHDPSLPPRRVVDILEAVGLYDGLGLYREWDWAALAKRPEIGALLGIGVAIVTERKADPLSTAGFLQVGRLPPGEVVLWRNAVPRVRLVHRTMEAEGDAETLAAVLDGAAEAERRAVIEVGTLAAPLEEPVSGAVESARIVLDHAERVIVEAAVAAPALLVLTDTFYPGWEASVAGEPAPILRADHAFRGVWLPAGHHRVVFRYAPRSVRTGAMISVVAAVMVLVCIAAPRGRFGASGGRQAS